jgi:hypothetical protein
MDPLSLRGAAVALFCAAAPLTGCGAAAASSSGTPDLTSVEAASGCDAERDRAAIKAMVGTFDVDFTFKEHDPAAGYTPKAPYYANATEVVTVIEETPKVIRLQHVLVAGKEGALETQKHWRQDWTFEDTEIVEYKGKRTWERRNLSPKDAKCTWSQAVFEVDDTPRYESWAKWEHGKDGSSWTSKETWRPLPRREYTKRSDYDVLVATNRHVVTPKGWRHEQANAKLVLAGNEILVKESGENTYEATKSTGTALAHAYLTETDAFWKAVRSEWSSLIAAHPRFVVLADKGGMPLYEHLFPMADAAKAKGAPDFRSKLHEVMQSYVQAAPPAVAAR